MDWRREFLQTKNFQTELTLWHCDDPDTDDEDGPINQQSSTRMLILKAVRKNQQIQKLEEKNPKM